MNPGIDANDERREGRADSYSLRADRDNSIMGKRVEPRQAWNADGFKNNDPEASGQDTSGSSRFDRLPEGVGPLGSRALPEGVTRDGGSGVTSG